LAWEFPGSGTVNNPTISVRTLEYSYITAVKIGALGNYVGLIEVYCISICFLLLKKAWRVL